MNLVLGVKRVDDTRTRTDRRSEVEGGEMRTERVEIGVAGRKIRSAYSLTMGGVLY